jgi:hypothetical protein
MSAIGGDIIEVTCNHPTLGDFTFYPKGSEDSTYDLGGFRSADEANGVDGSGAMIDQMNRVRWFFEIVYAWEQSTTDDLANMKSLGSDPVPGTWTFTHINGSVYSGSGKPVGDIQGNGNAGTFSAKISGGADLEKIV